MAHGSQTLVAPARDSLRVHRAVMVAVGPEALAEMARPLTGEEQDLLDQWWSETVGMTDEQFAAYAGVPASVGRELRRLLTTC